MIGPECAQHGLISSRMKRSCRDRAAAGFRRPAGLAARVAAGSNRRIRKTVRPVVWEGAGAQSPVPGPIGPRTLLRSLDADQVASKNGFGVFGGEPGHAR